MNYIHPNWKAPSNIRAISTTRQGGFSHAPFDQFNLGDHVGDMESHVLKNREKLKTDLELVHDPVWLTQVHSNNVVVLNKPISSAVKADASVTTQKNTPCIIMTADCLPILLCDQKGTQVAAIHAGWRGLASGIIKNAVEKFTRDPINPLIAWLGPAIGATAFEVGQDVYNAFEPIQSAFKPLKSGKYLADLYKIATYYLNASSVYAIDGGDYCTYTQPDLFFSYRFAGGVTGRMATLIWIT